ncbi:HNH endonuclease [Escherichia coli]
MVVVNSHAELIKNFYVGKDERNRWHLYYKKSGKQVAEKGKGRGSKYSVVFIKCPISGSRDYKGRTIFYVPLHRLVYYFFNPEDEAKLMPLAGYDVHHINHRSRDNHPDNLELMTHHEHMLYHEAHSAWVALGWVAS